MDLLNNARCERLGGRPSGYWVIRIQSFPRRPPTGSCMQFFYSQAVLKLHWCVQFPPTLPLTDQMNYFFFAKIFPCRDSNQGSLGHTRSTTNLEAAPWTLSQGQLIHEVAKFQPWGISGVCDLFPSEGPAHHLGEGGGGNLVWKYFDGEINNEHENEIMFLLNWRGDLHHADFTSGQSEFQRQRRQRRL